MKRIQVVNSATPNSDSLSLYLKEIKKVSPLTPDEEFALIVKVRNGDIHALEKLINTNLRFVVSVAKHYQHQGLGLADLIGEGNLGLLKAVERYDETRGFKFISYAVWWIRQSILKALDEHSRIVRLPRNKVNAANRIGEALVQLEQEFEREPTHDELATLLEVELREVQNAFGLKIRQVSIDAPLKDGEETSLTEMFRNPNEDLPDHQIVIKESLKKEIEILLNDLKKTQAEVVKMYYGLESGEQMTLVEISKKLNVSSERIRQIKEEAISKIKKSVRYKILKEFITEA